LKGNYLSRIDNPHLDLINRDGINLKAVYNPDWSDEKGMFVCAASDSDHAGYRIAITNLDGSFYRIYTDGDFIDDNPAWGPEGQKVLFARSAITDYNRFGARIMILDINTGQIDNLVETSSIGGATASLEPDY
jgi:Tol biopolymer transport system component